MAPHVRDLVYDGGSLLYGQQTSNLIYPTQMNLDLDGTSIFLSTLGNKMMHLL